MTRVRVTDPAKVQVRYCTFTVRLSGPQISSIVAGLDVAAHCMLAEESAEVQASRAALGRATHEPDLDAIAAAFERGEQVPGAELIDKEI